MTLRGGTFTARQSKGLGGDANSGPFLDLPLDFSNQLKYCVDFNDFLRAGRDYSSGGNGTDTLPWIEDLIGAGAGDASLVADSPTGILLLDAGGTDSTGIETVWTGGSTTADACQIITPTDGKTFACGYRVKPLIGALGYCFVGAADGGTRLLTTGGSVVSTNSELIGWYFGADSYAYVGVRSADNSITYDQLYSFEYTPNAWVEVSFVSTPTTAASGLGSTKFYYRLDGDTKWVFLGIESGLPTVPLSPYAFSAVNGVGDDQELRVDFCWTIIER